MRISTASLAVIRRPGPDGMPRYLAQWNEHWRAFNLAGGHKRENESFRACLVRELFEELGVLPEADDPDAEGPYSEAIRNPSPRPLPEAERGSTKAVSPPLVVQARAGERRQDERGSTKAVSPPLRCGEGVGGGVPDTLPSGPRCRVAREPLGRLEYEAFSQSAGERTFYRIELYSVELSPDAIAHVANDEANRWVSEPEIEAGRCHDGKAVSDTMRQHWGWLRRHEPHLSEVLSMQYEPKPIDTRHIELPGTIVELLERLAENTHEVWARQRLSDGWTYGARRDDALKHHPCLVPYGQLPESEKEYDRKTAMEALKVILALGYEIRKA